MIDVGFKNYILIDKIDYILKPGSSKVKWLIRESYASNRLINCTQGKKVCSIIILSTNHVVLSCLKYSSLIKRLKTNEKINDMIKSENINKNLQNLLNSVN